MMIDTRDPGAVEIALYEAGRTLLALRVSGCWPAQFRSGMPEVLRDLEDMKYAETEWRAPVPSPAKISAMDRALSWIRLLPNENDVHTKLRKLVLARLLVSPRTDRPIYSWKRLGIVYGCSENTAKSRWIDAVGRITSALNRPGLCTSSGGLIGLDQDPIQWSKRPTRIQVKHL